MRLIDYSCLTCKRAWGSLASFLTGCGMELPLCQHVRLRVPLEGYPIEICNVLDNTSTAGKLGRWHLLVQVIRQEELRQHALVVAFL